MPKEQKGPWEKFIDKTYIEDNMDRRKEISQEYETIENVVNNYYDKKISVHDLTRLLEPYVWGTLFGSEAKRNEENINEVKSVYSSSQIYAFENMLKAMSETENNEDIKHLTRCFLHDIAFENNPRKRAYLLGLLCYYSDGERLAKIEEELTRERAADPNRKIDQKTQDEIDIIQRIKSAAGAISKEEYEQLPENMQTVLSYILKNFPRDTDECQAARLVSWGYENDPHATRMPGVGERTISIIENMGERLDGCGLPRLAYLLPKGWGPSQEKIDEVEKYAQLDSLFGKELFTKMRPQIARVEEGNSRKINYVNYPMSPEEAFDYYKETRRCKDARDYEALEALENKFKRMAWQGLDETARQELGGDINNVVILKRTIRDYPKTENGKDIPNETKKNDEEEEKKQDIKTSAEN